MRNQLLTIALALFGTYAMAQQSLSWSHMSGLSPVNNLTVDCNEVFEFVSLGQMHPVAEGGLGTSTDPNFWTNANYTIPGGGTIQLSIPNAGTYYFRCGTNPAKQALWGYITVDGPSCGAASVEEAEKQITIYPNPVVNVLHLADHTGLIRIYDLSGKEVLRAEGNAIDVSNLPKGRYVIQSDEIQTSFIKN